MKATFPNIDAALDRVEASPVAWEASCIFGNRGQDCFSMYYRSPLGRIELWQERARGPVEVRSVRPWRRQPEARP